MQDENVVIEPKHILGKVLPSCIGCGTCIAVAGNVFEFGPDGKAIVKKQPQTPEENQEFTAGQSACPVQAIIQEELKQDTNKHVNTSCIGCGTCVAIAGDIFEFGPDGKAVVKKQPQTPEEIEMFDNAKSSCPVQAIE